MNVFIAHVEADQAAADDLKTFLKSRGMLVETETGERGFRHLQRSDVVIALWSQKSVFGQHRMQLERRMLDAWAEQQLVLVKLDHGFLPVGLRDLPAVDASFEQGRTLASWPKAERAARAAMQAALVETQARMEDAAPGAPPSFGASVDMYSQTRSSGSPSLKRSRLPSSSEPMSSREIEERIEDELSTDYESAPAPSRWRDMAEEVGRQSRQQVRRSRNVTLLLGALLVVIVGAGGAYLAVNGAGTQAVAIVLGASGATLLALVVWLLTSRGRARSARKSATRKIARAEAAAAPITVASPAPAPAVGQTPTPSPALFISYSHADDAAVTPLVAIVETHGRTVWIDKTGIQTGDGWAGEIVKAIKAAHGVVVMCSKHSFESDHVKREVYLADKYKKPMAPLFLEQAAPPEDFEYFFANVQWLELWKLPEADRAAAIGQALKAV